MRLYETQFYILTKLQKMIDHVESINLAEYNLDKDKLTKEQADVWLKGFVACLDAMITYLLQDAPEDRDDKIVH